MSFLFPCLLDEFFEDPDEGVGASVFESHFEVAVAGQQILGGGGVALQVRGAEDGHLD
jgi:hypothetical protein